MNIEIAHCCATCLHGTRSSSGEAVTCNYIKRKTHIFNHCAAYEGNNAKTKNIKAKQFNSIHADWKTTRMKEKKEKKLTLETEYIKYSPKKEDETVEQFFNRKQEWIKTQLQAWEKQFLKDNPEPPSFEQVKDKKVSTPSRMIEL